ncbi:hypothetical protein ACFQGT_10575 [Natrialbaceae archaeon GCM10025810]|uniref:hypothetical protein n=1 Tax=Halovalidus salilacus TaxID=3075124 RepID=UPI00360C63D1
MPACVHCGEEHPLPGSYMSHVLRCKDGNGTKPSSQSSVETPLEEKPDGSSDSPLESRVERIVASQLEPVETELDRLAADIEEVERFATVSLGERRLSQAEANLAEYSASLTEFSERTLEKVNDLEARLEFQTIVLAAIVEAIAESEIEVDASEIQAYRSEQLVTERSASNQLEAAIDELQS